jgi:cell division protein FtsB
MNEENKNIFEDFQENDPDYDSDPLHGKNSETKQRKILPLIAIAIIAIFSLGSMFMENLSFSRDLFTDISDMADERKALEEEGVEYNEQGYIIEEKTEKEKIFDNLMVSIGNINQSITKIHDFYEVDYNHLYFGKFENKEELIRAMSRAQYHITKSDEIFAGLRDDLISLAETRDDVLSSEQKNGMINVLTKYASTYRDFYTLMAPGMTLNANNFDKLDGYNAKGNRVFHDNSLQEEWSDILEESRKLNDKLTMHFDDFKENIKSIALINI